MKALAPTLRPSCTCLVAGITLAIAAAFADIAVGDNSVPEQPVPDRKADPRAVSEQIDRLIDAKLRDAKVPASSLADDAEFLRRVTLHLTGRIPTYDSTVAFLNSTDPDKRQKRIDELLEDPNYGLRFARIWRNRIVSPDDTSTGGLEGKYKFTEWLSDAFNKNRGWQEIVTDLVTAEGYITEKPQAIYILANRDMLQPAPEKIVAMTSKLFLGISLRCAQCHKHPYVREWKQADFWGLAAFFSLTRDDGGVDNGQVQKSLIAEKGGKFRTSRMDGTPYPLPLTGARIGIPSREDPDKKIQVVKAKFFKGSEPVLPENGPFRGAFAEWLTAPQNPYFARAAVNRTWSHFFGRGFVNPLDRLEENDASHPELLAALAAEFAGRNFDLKHLIRCICNSRAYQRTSRPLAANAEDTQLFSHMAIQVMDPDALFDSRHVIANKVPEARGDVRGKFISEFTTKEADGDATEFTYTLPHALYLMARTDNQAVPPQASRPGMTPEAIIEALYLTYLSRKPTAAELGKMTSYLAAPGGPRSPYGQIAWMLSNSAEFVLVH